jgi:hypothetical protein
MKDFTEILPVTRRSVLRLSTAIVETGKRGIALSLASLMIPLGVAPLAAYGQEAPPPPPDQAQPANQ